jgi:hypothetical protein
MTPKSKTATEEAGPSAQTPNSSTNADEFTVGAQGRQLIRGFLAYAPPDLRDLGYSSDARYGPEVNKLAGESADEMVAMIAAVIRYWTANGMPLERRGVNSYHLKHRVERWVWSTTGKPTYISNGAAIAAALVAAVEVERDSDPKFPNVTIGRLPRGRAS